MSSDYSQYQGLRERRNELDSFEMEFHVLTVRAKELANNPDKKPYEDYLASQVDTVRQESAKISMNCQSSLITLFNEYIDESMLQVTKELMAHNVSLLRLEKDRAVVELLTGRMKNEEQEGVGEYKEKKLAELSTHTIGSLTDSSDREYDAVAELKSREKWAYIPTQEMRDRVSKNNFFTKYSKKGNVIGAYALYYQTRTQRFVPEILPDDERAKNIINSFIASGMIPGTKQAELIVEVPDEGKLAEFLINERNFFRRSILRCTNDAEPARSLLVHVLGKRK